MSEIFAQASFNSGEWSPNLYARVDIAKYKSGAALLRNFFVDYRGGASSRPGTQYIIQCKDSANPVRLIPFQAAFNIGYVLECGNGYIRFIYRGGVITSNTEVISGATQANPCVLTIVGTTLTVGKWIYVSGVGGMTQINGRYFIVANVVGNLVTLHNLDGTNLNSTTFSAYTAGGTASRIYEISSPYTSADDLRLLKFTSKVNQMIICHPNHSPYVLTLITATNWTLVPISIGTTVSAPTGLAITTTLKSGSVNYSYGVTSIDSNGQESSLSDVATLLDTSDIRTTAGSIKIAWNPNANAVGYNIYESNVSYFGVVPYGVQYGFVGTVKGSEFIDSNISPDFTQTPPISRNPFAGSGVAYVTVTGVGAYLAVPTVNFVGVATIPAVGIAQLGVNATPGIAAGGAGYAVGDLIDFPNSLTMYVDAVAAGAVTAWHAINLGSITSGATPPNPLAQITTTGGGTGATANATWGVRQVNVLTSGSGYAAAPGVTFSAGLATATAVLAPTSNGNPTVPSFFQQRLVLAGPAGAPETLYMSRPGSPFNFDVSAPVRSDDAITATLVSGVLNSIKSIASSTAGMLVLTDNASWLINGGSSGSAVTPTSIVASMQSGIGANDVPPIVANYDILYVQSKGSGVRDLAFNIYYNVFTGTDISVMSSHLFANKTIVEWAWAQQPYYIAWSVRDDGKLLSLTFLKEQEFVGWAQHYTNNGNFKSIAVASEPYQNTNVDATYFVIERVINGNTVKYIERLSERTTTGLVADAFCVDAGLRYSGTPASTFIGGEHLVGQTVTGLADGLPITPFVMPTSGIFTLPAPASKVSVGIGYTCDLQTLALDLGEPTVQGKVKKINSVDVRVFETLGLSIGPDSGQLVQMKDLVLNNVSSMLTGQASQVVTNLVTGDAKTILSPAYTIPGQYYIRQSNPYPATILGVFPSYTIGDTK